MLFFAGLPAWKACFMFYAERLSTEIEAPGAHPKAMRLRPPGIHRFNLDPVELHAGAVD